MDWSDLRYALAVARHGSVPDAARALGVAHTTLYRRLNAFEEVQGTRFFDRTGASWELTEAGRELLTIGAEVEQRVGAFERRLRGRDTRLDGTVTIATVEPLAVELTHHLAAFRVDHPGIRVSLHVTNERVAVGKDADIALRVTREPPETLRGRRIATVGFSVYAAASRVVEGAADLKTAPWVCFDASQERTPQGRWEQRNVDDAQVVFRTSSRAVFVEAVRLGIGVGVLPCGLAADVPNLVSVSPVIEELGLPLWLLTHVDLAEMPRVRVLLDSLADALIASRSRLQGLVL
jgi:DNA-binding transcriptional LysR family regulator